MVEAITEKADSPQEALEQLRDKHDELEQKLDDLNSPRSLSPEEEREIQVIKKQKLAIKDEMSSIRDDL